MPQSLLCLIITITLLVGFADEVSAEYGRAEINFSVQVSEVAVEYTKMLNGVSVVLEPEQKAPGASSSKVVNLNSELELGGEGLTKLMELGESASARFSLSQPKAGGNKHVMVGTYRGTFPLAVLTGNGGIARFYSLPSSVLVGSYILSLHHPLCGRLSAHVYISEITIPASPLKLSYAGPCKQG